MTSACGFAGEAAATTVQPSESSRGTLGTIAPQMTDDWSGTKLELDSSIPNVYYVTLDNGATELIAEDWLDLASNEA